MRQVLIVLAMLILAVTAVESAKQAPKPPVAKPAPKVVKVKLKEWGIAPTPIKVKAGLIRFDCMNTGEATHALSIVGQKVKTKNIDPGGTASLTVTLKPGSYTLYCPIDKHREQGMQAKFTVTK